MEILISHLGDINECFVATGLIKTLFKKYKTKKNPSIYLIVKNKENRTLFVHNEKVKNIYTIKSVPEEFMLKNFDIYINLFPNDIQREGYPVIAKEKLGFNYSGKADDIAEQLYSKNGFVKKNLFQIYHALANLPWKGGGFDLPYYPKSKSKATRTGVAISNIKLRNYTIDHLSLDKTKIWFIPFKKDFFKRADNVNKCKYIITDDLLTANIAACLRKKIFFLKTLHYPFKLELFKDSTIFEVPDNILRGV
jgi:hypothetical protein